ncbi:MAG: hypothetical protein HDR56_03025 [Treponema sp.]|nr:hypothetical protein [Treponema sp.]
MNSSATVAKTKAIRVVLACAVFCAAVLCPAQETARGIVAEKIDAVQNRAERPEPEIRFQLGHSNYMNSVAWSLDSKHISSYKKMHRLEIFSRIKHLTQPTATVPHSRLCTSLPPDRLQNIIIQ